MKLFTAVATISAVSACGFSPPPPPIDWAAIARALEVFKFMVFNFFQSFRLWLSGLSLKLQLSRMLHQQPPLSQLQLQPPQPLQRQLARHLLVRLSVTVFWLQIPRIDIFRLVWLMMVLTSRINTRQMVSLIALTLTARKLRTLSAAHHGFKMVIATTNAGNCVNNSFL